MHFSVSTFLPAARKIDFSLADAHALLAAFERQMSHHLWFGENSTENRWFHLRIAQIFTGFSREWAVW
jgi:hypothetical protein